MLTQKETNVLIKTKRKNSFKEATFSSKHKILQIILTIVSEEEEEDSDSSF